MGSYVLLAVGLVATASFCFSDMAAEAARREAHELFVCTVFAAAGEGDFVLLLLN